MQVPPAKDIPVQYHMKLSHAKITKCLSTLRCPTLLNIIPNTPHKTQAILSP